jgi:hypothetical protein
MIVPGARASAGRHRCPTTTIRSKAGRLGVLAARGAVDLVHGIPRPLARLRAGAARPQQHRDDRRW